MEGAYRIHFTALAGVLGFVTPGILLAFAAYVAVSVVLLFSMRWVHTSGSSASAGTMLGWFAGAWRLFLRRPLPWLALALAAALPAVVRGPAAAFVCLGAYRYLQLDPSVRLADVEMSLELWYEIPGVTLLEHAWGPAAYVGALMPLILWAVALRQVRGPRERGAEGRQPALTRAWSVGLLAVGWIVCTDALSYVYWQWNDYRMVTWLIQMMLAPLVLFVTPFVLAHGLNPAAALARNARGVRSEWHRWVVFSVVLWVPMCLFAAFLGWMFGVLDQYPSNMAGATLPMWLGLRSFLVLVQIVLTPWLALAPAVAFAHTFGFGAAARPAGQPA